MNFPKNKAVYNKKYRNSFKKHRAHKCLLTGHEWQEFDSVGITGCHITVGRYGANIKDDSLILPLRQDLHMEMDKNQVEFLVKNYENFPADLIDRASNKVDKVNGKTDLIGVIKQMARDYYEQYRIR